MPSDVVIVREDDPRCNELEIDGYEIIGYSWGANLRLDDSSDLTNLGERVRRVRSEGFIIRELTSADLTGLSEVESANFNDYPQSAATPHEMPTLERHQSLHRAGVRFWGVFFGATLVAVTGLEPLATRWNTTFTSVLREYRGRGLGAAVKAASIMDLFNEGARWFSTGGAASNTASLGANTALGYVIEPIWRTYTKTLTPWVTKLE